MNQAQLPYVACCICCSTFLASVSQVLLKKAALREHKSLLAEYTDWRVVLGYGLFLRAATLLSRCWPTRACRLTERRPRAGGHWLYLCDLLWRGDLP